MGKDPAVLFYTSDFLSGTSFFTNEQRGQYILLLCQQHQLRRIPKNHMINICKSHDSPVMAKFTQDKDGYYNERMELEAQKRKEFCLSRSNNKSGRKKSYDSHMENENRNVKRTTKTTKDINTILKPFTTKPPLNFKECVK